MPTARTRVTLWFSRNSASAATLSSLGLTIGIMSAPALALLVAGLGPLLALAALLGVLAGLYIITDVNIALYTIIAHSPAAALWHLSQSKSAITPTLLDLALAGFLLVYLFQWMTGPPRRACN